MPPKLRLFIAVNINEEIRKAIEQKLKDIQKIDSGIKWVEPQNLHITMKFLGWVEEEKVDRVVRILGDRAKNTIPFALSFSGWGGFPPGKHPRVLWIGIKEGGGALSELAKKLEESFSKEGFQAEEREFSPHLTVGRVKIHKGIDKVLEKMAETGNLDFGSFTVESADLMESSLTKKGPIYEAVFVGRLGG